MLPFVVSYAVLLFSLLFAAWRQLLWQCCCYYCWKGVVSFLINVGDAQIRMGHRPPLLLLDPNSPRRGRIGPRMVFSNDGFEMGSEDDCHWHYYCYWYGHSSCCCCPLWTRTPSPSRDLLSGWSWLGPLAWFLQRTS